MKGMKLGILTAAVGLFLLAGCAFFREEEPAAARQQTAPTPTTSEEQGVLGPSTNEEAIEGQTPEIETEVEAATVDVPDSARERKPFVVVRSAGVTPGMPVAFLGEGFEPGEEIDVVIESPNGRKEVGAPSVFATKDGQIAETSVQLPADLADGRHVLRLKGASGARASVDFYIHRVPPKVTLEANSGKPFSVISIAVSGLVPKEAAEVRLGSLQGTLLGKFSANARGEIEGTFQIPLITEGDYQLIVQAPASGLTSSVGFNVQGFHPWIILDNYAPIPYQTVGLAGYDFAPGEDVLVYVGDRSEEPLLRAKAGPDGVFQREAAIEAPPAAGDVRLVVVGANSGTEAMTSFEVLAFQPSLELTTYAGTPGAELAVIGSGWARNETLRAYVGDKPRVEVGAFVSGPDGSFQGLGPIRIPAKAGEGGTAVTVVGEVSRAEATVWFDVLPLKPSAELSSYEGPAGSRVTFTGRGFLPGERVTIHERERGGSVLAEAVSDDTGTFESVGSYVTEGNPGDEATPFVFVGEESGAEAVTHFKIVAP